MYYVLKEIFLNVRADTKRVEAIHQLVAKKDKELIAEDLAPRVQ